MGGAIISELGGGIIPLRGAASSRNWGAASSGISSRSLVTGHAFLARFPEASKGGRFLGYRLDLPVIPGTVLLDGTSDIDGVNQIATWRAPVKPPRATFERLSIKHLPFPIVDPEGYRKTVAQITDNADLATRYATWIKETIVAEFEVGESVLVVTHKAMIEQGRLPRNMSFDDPLVLNGRRVAFLTYGRGVGSNRFKEATTVILCGEFWRPHRVSMGKALGMADIPANHPYLREMSNVNTRQALFTTIKNGDLLMWSKQLAMRGAARNFDDHGVCGKMKLVAIGELDLWMQCHGLMFPGASFDMSEATKAKAKADGRSTAVAAFILDHKGDGFTSKELCEASGVLPSNLAKALKSPLVKSALTCAGLSYVPGKGRALSSLRPLDAYGHRRRVAHHYLVPTATKSTTINERVVASCDAGRSDPFPLIHHHPARPRLGASPNQRKLASPFTGARASPTP